MRPANSQLNPANRGLLNAELSCTFCLALGAMGGVENLLASQLCRWIPLAGVVGFIAVSISLILERRSPAEVQWVDAMTISAGVSSEHSLTASERIEHREHLSVCVFPIPPGVSFDGIPSPENALICGALESESNQFSHFFGRLPLCLRAAEFLHVELGDTPTIKARRIYGE